MKVSEMALRLSNKTALVTGAGQGIGRGCALMFARQGARVLAADVDPGALAQTVAAGAGSAGTIEPLEPADLADETAVTALFGRIAGRVDAIDILVNAAAFATFRWIEELSLAEWRRTLQGELDIVFLPCRAAWPLLKASGKASIINFASANAYHALPGSPALAHCAGKGGVLAMTRQLAMEGAPHGIRANTIAPGFILTAATSAHIASDPGFKAKVLEKNMIKRLGVPEDVAFLATYLASDESSYVTGADFSCDAGATAW
jgi:NAD(P)-dependent dehydrogenase (short-subunit alcohol dehydrogenase family)